MILILQVCYFKFKPKISNLNIRIFSNYFILFLQFKRKRQVTFIIYYLLLSLLDQLCTHTTLIVLLQRDETVEGRSWLPPAARSNNLGVHVRRIMPHQKIKSIFFSKST